ncbi:MAG: site-specific DNA-methyltransferase [Pelagibacterales bacterium]|nr:site-specific DNA-methyltransferase [Pelagibacterales bacterium]
MEEIKINSIVCGETISELKKIPDESIDCIFADPPYNLQLENTLFRPNQTLVNGVDDTWDQFENLNHYDKFCNKWISECRRVLKKNGTLWVIGTYHNIFRIGKIIQDKSFWILNDIIWNKKNPMPNFKGTRFTNAHETLIWAAKSKKSKYTFNYNSLKCFNDDKQMRSDWDISICNGTERIKDENGHKVHSTQKPESLLFRIILSSTNPGDLILDPFFGTGTTGAVAKKLGRNFYGIDKSKKYIDVAENRIKRIKKLDDTYLKTIEKKRSEKRIPFGYLIENGIIEPGMKLFDSKSKIEASVMVDGSINCKNFKGSIHSVGAKIQGAESCNGWSFWHVKIENKLTPINHFREKIRNNN